MRRLLAAQEPLPTSFFRLRSAPGALQEALDRLSRAVSVEIPFWTPFRTPFRDLKWAPGASKLRFSRETSCEFCAFAAFSSNRFRTPFCAYLGSLLGAPWAPRALKPFLEFSQEPSKALLEYFFSAREPSKSAPRALQEVKGRPNRFLTPPGSLQEPFWLHFGPHLWSIF